MSRKKRGLTVWLATAPTPVLTLFAVTWAFSAYFCMYAFRKPFSAASFEGYQFLGSQATLKTAFVISQIVGYALSKFIGIRFCSEITPSRRLGALVSLVGISELALLLFAILPPDMKVIAMFLNGLPLGMIWGLVVLYLEGRQTSELLLAGLSCSFILSSGWVKMIGLRLMDVLELSEFWMPFVTGLVFFPLFLLSVFLLDQLPQQSQADIEARTRRTTMTRRERMYFLRQFAPGLVMLVAAYLFLTAYRDFRDNFAAELFDLMGYKGQEQVFAQSETSVMFGVMAALAALNVIRSNRWGLVGAFAVMTLGTILLAVGTLLFDYQRISGLTWMILSGTGVYLAYVPYGSILFDRLIASTRTVGTAVFVINVADSIGYAGSIGVMLTKDLALAGLTRLEFFRYFSYFMATLGTCLLVLSCIYFALRHRPGHEEHGPATSPVA
jgi:hypothetical protein